MKGRTVWACKPWATWCREARRNKQDLVSSEVTFLDLILYLNGYWVLIISMIKTLRNSEYTNVVAEKNGSTMIFGSLQNKLSVQRLIRQRNWAIHQRRGKWCLQTLWTLHRVAHTCQSCLVERQCSVGEHMISQNKKQIREHIFSVQFR
jgi:hypothetical protein